MALRSFETLIGSSNDAIFAHLGRSATYLPAGPGPSVTVTVILVEGTEALGIDGYPERRPRIDVKQSDLITVERGGRFRIGADEWMVDRAEQHGAKWLVSVRKEQRR